MGFLLLQSRPGGEYLKAFSWPPNLYGGFGIERQREKVFCISKSVGFGELKLFHCPLALGVRGYCIMIAPLGFAHMISSYLNPVADGCGHNWPPCTGLFLGGGLAST